MNFIFKSLNLFLPGGELALGDFLAILELPLEFLLGFFQLEALFRKLFGQAIQLPLPLGFFGQ